MYYFIMHVTLLCAGPMAVVNASAAAPAYNLGNNSYNLNNGTTSVTGMCTGNSNPAENVACPAGYNVLADKKGSLVPRRLTNHFYWRA